MRAEIASAAAPQVHKWGEQYLLVGELPHRTRFWKPHGVESPQSRSRPGSQLQGWRAGVTWEERKRSEGQVWGRRDVLL